MASAFVLIRVGTGEYLDFAKSAKEKIGKIKGRGKGLLCLRTI